MKVVASNNVQGSTNGKKLPPNAPPRFFGSAGHFKPVCGNNIMKNNAICLRIGPEKCVEITVAPCALKYFFTAFVMVLAKGGHVLPLLKAIAGS